MKKILIVNNNMKVGGVQKSLYNLLWSLEGGWDVTLLLFRKTGAYLDKLPPWVRVIEARSLFRYLGCSQGECTGPDKLKRGALAATAKLFGRPAAMGVLLASQRTLPERYDWAIAFLQNGNRKNFYGGVQEFVLRRVNAVKKAAFIHCDWRTSGANCPENNALLGEFDRIAACSEGCRRALLEILPELTGKTMVVPNCHRFGEIRELSRRETVAYTPGCFHVLMVTRLAHEKGIDRAIRAVSALRRKGMTVMLHLVGAGPMEPNATELTKELDLVDAVRFYGEQENPYRFMPGADLLLIASYHEAAPMVIGEARCLGLPVLTVETTSAYEMVAGESCGWVCGNSQEELEKALADLIACPEALKKMKETLREIPVSNGEALAQVYALIEG